MFFGNRLTTLAPVVLVGILVALTFWLDNIAQPAPRGPGASRHDPDYIVEKLSAMLMGETGTASYTLSAAKLMHYPDDDSTILTTPKFVSHPTTQNPVTITASQAVVSANGEHVYFQDDVIVTRPATHSASELTARTEFLHVVPELGIAKTDRSVTITDAATKVTAMGLELDSETRILRLQSKVRGTYDPAAAPRKGGGQ